MKPFVIKNEAQYEAALAHVATLMNAPPGSSQEAELELWGTLVELYEKDAHPIPLPDPIAAIKFRMEQAGLARKDMVPYLGSPSKVSEVLSGKRPLSLPMMRRLHEGLGIPAAVLLRQPGADGICGADSASGMAVRAIAPARRAGPVLRGREAHRAGDSRRPHPSRGPRSQTLLASAREA